MGGGGGWDYDYSENALKRSSQEYEAQAKQQGISRQYKGKESQGLPPPTGKTISTDSPTPLVVAVDVSGSMDQWPRVIFTKLPVLYNEAKLHLPDVEISFAAIGDASCHTLQVCDFARGKDLEEGINAIHPCGQDEYFEMAMYYYARHCTLGKARRGLLVICGNEPYRESLSKILIRATTGDDVPGEVKTADVLKELLAKFDVYMLYVPTCTGIEVWRAGLGPQMVLEMKDPARIVDCIIGLASVFADDCEAFKTRIAIRQTPEQVQQVLETLHPLLAAHPGKKPKAEARAKPKPKAKGKKGKNEGA